MRSSGIRALPTLLLIPATAGWMTITGTVELEPSSKLWVTGTSTVRSWQCAATSFDATIVTAHPGGTAAAIIAGEKALSTVTMSIPVEKLDCKNGTMNEHMLKAMKAKEFATIGFKLATYELTTDGSAARATLNGTLNLGGVEKAITMQVDARQEGSALRVTGVHEVNMKEYGLKPPSLMLGTMKVGEKVKVNFDLLLKD